MDIIKSINESLKTLIPVNKSGSGLQVEETFLSEIEGSSVQNLLSFISSVKQLSNTRQDIITDLQNMMNDSVVGSAIEMITEDATQMDFDRMHVCWAEPNLEEYKSIRNLYNISGTEKEKEDIIDTVHHFLYDILKIDQNLYPIAYNLVAYGEVFLKTYESDIIAEREKPKDEQDEKLVVKRGHLYEIITDPLAVQDIQEYGDNVGFVAEDKDKNKVIYGTRDYIHIINDRGNHRDKINLRYYKGTTEISKEFKVKFGTSFINQAREAFETLELLELILLVARFNKSAFYRIFKIEVGAFDRKKVKSALAEFQKAITKTETVDIPGKKYSSRNQPLPLGGSIYVPTRNGKGDVTVDTVGGDMDIKALLDLDYYRTKLFGALKIPKAYLGDAEDVSGGIGNQSLLKIDVRYSRMVRHCQACLAVGIKALCDYYLYTQGREADCNKFTIVLPRLYSAEENDRSTTLNDTLTMAQTLKSIISEDEEFFKKIDKDALYEYILAKMLNLKELWDNIMPKEEKTPSIIQKDLSDDFEEEAPEEEMGEEM